MGAENFIPWEQIEPLVRPGMTGRELKVALCGRLGLDPDSYFFAFQGWVWEPTRDRLRYGCHVRKGKSSTPGTLDEVIA